MELIYERATPRFRSQWPVLEKLLSLAAPQPGVGDWTVPYLYLPSDGRVREAGAWPTPCVPEDVGSWDGDSATQLEEGILHDNPDARLAAMDRGAVAKHLIAPGASIDAVKALPSNLAAGVLASYNQFILSYCERTPDRLKAVLQVHAAEPHWSAKEIEELAGDPTVAAISICLPVRLAPDNGLEPIWAAIDASGLPLVQRRSFASNVWSADRYLAHIQEAGVLDRYPRLRIGFVGGSCAWLARESAEKVRRSAPAERGQIFVALNGSESRQTMERLVETTPALLLWQSGFPYCGLTYSSTDALSGLGEGERRAVLEDNPARWLSTEA
jgi:predicted TIM-barrel fold metal-dependent hydrolase